MEWKKRVEKRKFSKGVIWWVKMWLPEKGSCEPLANYVLPSVSIRSLTLHYVFIPIFYKFGHHKIYQLCPPLPEKHSKLQHWRLYDFEVHVIFKNVFQNFLYSHSFRLFLFLRRRDDSSRWLLSVWFSLDFDTWCWFNSRFVLNFFFANIAAFCRYFYREL